MWKSVISRMTQARSLVTTSHNLAYNKGGPFSSTGYVKKKQSYGQGDDFEFSDKNSFRERDTQFGKRNQNRRSYTEEPESRHYTFDSAREDSNYPEKNYKRFQRNEDPFNAGEHRENQRESNANLVEIGVPGKWKVGAGFVKEADRLRNKAKTHKDFMKIEKTKGIKQDPSIKRDPGIKRQAKVLKQYIEPNEMTGEEDLADETDVMKFDQVYDATQKDKEAIKELVKMKMVQKKYFKEPKESMLSWSDKEHIRYLHNNDPQQWNFEMIAEHFRIDPQVAKAVATAKWIPKKPKTTNGIHPTSEEIYPLANVTEVHHSQVEEPPIKSSTGKKKVTWQELRAGMGEPDDRISTFEKSEPPPVVLESINAQQTALDYVNGNGPSRWVSDQSAQPELKVEKSEKSETLYYYDNKHGYQHPLGKPEDEKVTDLTGAVKNGELLQKGDSFYAADGELLYRVPGLTK